MMVAKKMLPVLFLALAACGDATQKQAALDLLAPPEGAVIGARFNPVAAELRLGLKFEADAVQRLRIEDSEIRAYSSLEWRVPDLFPGDIYTFELTVPKQPVAFGSLMRIEVGYAKDSEIVDCHFRAYDGAMRIATSETPETGEMAQMAEPHATAQATERDNAWVFPCEATVRPDVRFIDVLIYPAVTYSSFVRSEAVTGALEFKSLAYRWRTQSDSASGD